MSHVMTLVYACALAVAVFVGLAVTAEGVARFALRRTPYRVYPRRFRLRVHPHAETFAPELDPGRVVRFDADDHGARVTEVPAGQRIRQPYRLFVGGGSAVECFFLDQDATWPAVLGRELHQRTGALAAAGYDGVQVAIYAKSGVDALDLAHVVTHCLPRGRFDAAVLMVGGSSVIRWLTAGAPADWCPGLRPLDAIYSEHPERRYTWSLQGSAAREAIRRLHARLTTPVFERHNVGSFVGRGRRMRQQAEEIITTVPDPAPMLDGFEVGVRRAIRVARERVPDVFCLAQPNYFRPDMTPRERELLWLGGVGNVLTEEVRRFFAAEVMSDLMRQANERLRLVCEQEGVVYVESSDLLSPFPRHFYDSWHLTEYGAEVLGAFVADLMGEHVASRRRPSARAARPAPAASPAAGQAPDVSVAG